MYLSSKLIIGQLYSSKKLFFNSSKSKLLLHREHLAQLTYMTMCIKESLRLYSTVYNVAKKIDRDIEFSCPFKNTKNTFPKGSEICTSIYIQHLSPLLWKEPKVIVFFV